MKRCQVESVDRRRVVDGALGQSFNLLAVVSLGLFLKNFKEVWLLEELNCILNQY